MASHADCKYCAAVKEEDDQELQECEQQNGDGNPSAVAVKEEPEDELSSELCCPQHLLMFSTVQLLKDFLQQVCSLTRYMAVCLSSTDRMRQTS